MRFVAPRWEARPDVHLSRTDRRQRNLRFGESRPSDSLRELGLSATEAMTLFYKQVVLRLGVPFEVSIPNVETVEGLREAREPGELTEYSSLDELKAAL